MSGDGDHATQPAAYGPEAAFGSSIWITCGRVSPTLSTRVEKGIGPVWVRVRSTGAVAVTAGKNTVFIGSLPKCGR